MRRTRVQPPFLRTVLLGVPHFEMEQAAEAFRVCHGDFRRDIEQRQARRMQRSETRGKRLLLSITKGKRGARGQTKSFGSFYSESCEAGNNKNNPIKIADSPMMTAILPSPCPGYLSKNRIPQPKKPILTMMSRLPKKSRIETLTGIFDFNFISTQRPYGRRTYASRSDQPCRSCVASHLVWRFQVGRLPMVNPCQHCKQFTGRDPQF
jgi:hypothetical protein